MMILRPGSTRFRFTMVWAAPAPITPGRSQPGKARAFSVAPVAIKIFFRPDDTAVPGMGNTQSPSGKDAVNSDFHPGCFAFRQQLAAQLHPAYPGPVVPGAEKTCESA